jgi:hypothetical protein
MPSYKDKFIWTKLKMADIEKKILITDTVLLELKSTILELQDQNNSLQSRDNADGYIRSQFVTAMKELETTLNLPNKCTAEMLGVTTNELLLVAIESLAEANKTLRDSSTRAATILEEISVKTTGKLLKREQREKIHQASLSSIAATLAQSPERGLSPPAEIRRQHSPASSNASRGRNMSG